MADRLTVLRVASIYINTLLTISTHVDPLRDQGLLAEDTDTVLTLDPGLAQGTGHTGTDEPNSLLLLYTLIDEWDTVGNVKVVRSRLVDP
jgi:hypothetical protein